MRLFLFDDRATDDWRPFALTRPCGELRFGDRLLRERIEAFVGLRAEATLSRAWLTRFSEAGAPPVRDRTRPLPPGDRLLLSSRFVPARGTHWRTPEGSRSHLLLCEGEAIGAWLPAGVEDPGEEWLSRPDEMPGARALDLAGTRLRNVWDLVGRNPDRLAEDLAEAVATDLPPGAHRIGTGPIRLARDVVVEPGVLFDTRHGGVRLDEGVEVRSGARLAGPLHAGPGSRLLGGSYECVSAGPRSYMRGEIEESIVLGYANKAHDGFLGHALIGRWVNLGAMTTNSDLKNNYGPVRLGGPEGEIETGLVKLGCLIGDHVKSAIGTMINTGTVVGAGANLFGDERPPKWVPPFAWGHAAGSPSYDRDRFLATAATVLGRRGVDADQDTLAWLGACWDEARRRADR